MPDVYAAGDIRAGSVNRVVAAVGEGSAASRLTRKSLTQSSEGPRPNEWARGDMPATQWEIAHPT